MEEQRIFVGRRAELEQFSTILENSRGQVVVVVGQAGIGKTWLIHKMTTLAVEHPDLTCGWVRYEVTPTDTADATMELMMDNAFDAAQTKEGSFNKTDRRRKQWYALLKTVVPKGGDIAELVQSLQRDQHKHTRDQFLERLRLISKRMPPNGRAVFVIDPEKYMEERSVDSWRLVVRKLPEKVKFLFAQRPEDELVKNNVFMALPNVVRIPQEPLGVLAETQVDDLVRLRAATVGQSGKVLGNAVSRYKGHPYAIQAALDLIEAGTKLEDLPSDTTPEGIAKSQWEQICRIDDDAIRLFEAYAVLEVGVPDTLVQSVSGVDAITRRRLHSDAYLRGLLREEGQGRRIYHAILADHVLAQMEDDRKVVYHRGAVVFCRAKLKDAADTQTMPDALAAVRLPEHILAAEGEKAFASAFISECTQALINLGLLDACISLSERAFKATDKDSAEEAILLGNLGFIYHTRGDLDQAEEMHRKALEINKKLNRREGIAAGYSNLGLIYHIRGDLDQAEEMHRKALEINKKLARHEGMASEYRKLGNIYLTRRDLDEAEKMYEQGLEIDEKLDRREAMASDYAALGVVSFERDDLEKAEEWHRKGLEIETRLGRLAGEARQYANLGNIYFRRRDFNAAEEMHKKSLEIFEELKDRERIADEYGNLGNIYFRRSDLNAAEEMLKKSLEIQKELRRLEGMASDYAILGKVYQQRGDKKIARKHWENSVCLYKKIGILHKVKEVQHWIKGL